jgi:O-acetylhomoserine (thiol)-lyase
MLVRPFDHGAAVIVYSATKYLGGHGTAIAGMIVDGGNFEWGAHPTRQPALNTPDPSYHGAVWSEAAKPLGPIAYILKARVTLLRDLGPAISPFNAFLVLQGIETLPLRMARHCETTLTVANWLAKRPEVSTVIHPAHAKGRDAELTQRYLPNGMGGLLGFELHGGAAAGRMFIDSLQLFYHVANIGDARSLAIHPASTTHSQLAEADQMKSGVSPGYVRLSIGLEHADDLLADLDQALRASTMKVAAE